MKKVLFISNIPAPYRIDFYNCLGQRVELTVLFEARRAAGIRFNWNDDSAAHFHAIFLSDGEIDETHVDRRILPYIRRGAYDHIVATNYGYYTETAALLKMRLMGIPYDLELDGGVVRPNENAAKRAVKRFLIKGAKHLFSTGTATDALFTHYGADPKRLVRYPFTSQHARDILPAVPTAAEKAALRESLGIPYPTMLLAVGQFIRRKGFDVLLHACSQLPEGAGAYIIGGEATEEYRAIVAEHNLQNVHFLPFQDADTLKRYYMAADVFVLPTREDMWGLVVNEAMSYALPVITTDRCNAGLALIENGVNGCLVPPDDAAQLADRMNDLLADEKKRVRFAERALSAIGGYTIERMADIHMQVFYE